MVRPHRLLLAAALAGSLCAARAARAQDTQYQVAVGAALQATDNVQFTPMNGPASVACYDANPNNDGQNCPVAGFIGDLAPAVVFSYETPRWLHQLAYNFNFAWVLGGGDRYNYENRLEVRSRYDVSELTVANFMLRGAQGQQTFFPQAQPGQPVAALVPGDFVYVNVEAQQGITRMLSEDATFTERVGAQLFRPITAEDPRPGVLTANAQLGVTYNDLPTEYGMTLTSQLTSFETYCNTAAQCGDADFFACVDNRCVVIENPQLAEPVRQELEARANPLQLLTRLEGTVRRDFQNGFTAEVSAGVQQIMRLTDLGGDRWDPLGRLALRYAREEAALELVYDHAAQVNVGIGGLIMADNVNLIGNIPIDRETRNVVVQLQAGYQHASVVDALGDFRPGFDLLAGDVALEYRPQRWLPTAAVALRYQFRYQITEPGAPTIQQAIPEALHAMRNAVILNLGFQFPERAQGQ